MSNLKTALNATNIRIRKYDTTKNRSVYTDNKALTIPGFADELIKALGNDLKNHPAIVDTFGDPSKMEALIEEYVESEGMAISDEVAVEIPPELSHLTLNVDKSSKEPGAKRFFCTNKDEIVDPHTSGLFYMESLALTTVEAVKMSRSVVPKYLPRSGPGIHPRKDEVTKDVVDYFNRYIPPTWERWKKENPATWNNLPDKAPALVLKLLKHLIPIKKEREYLYAWIFASLTSRAYVFLVLSGAPGAGKNRLKLLLRALHGKENSTDGKKETFGANESKFNSQMEENTLVWYDELKYGPDMEARMKEYQNDYISIERKGVDASRSTEIFSSMAISNNYPRDNYLLFNSRKFAPLKLAEKDLKLVMPQEDIAELSAKIDPEKPTFDVVYVAQIAKWILKWGPKYFANYPMLEYQGPKFWELAHSSMSKWQKTAIVATTMKASNGAVTPGFDMVKGAFRWSKVEEILRRRKELESREYRDPNTVRAFFDSYCDEKGKRVFETEDVVGKETYFHDFWIKPLEKLATPNEERKKLDLKMEGDRPIGLSNFAWRKLKKEKEGPNVEKDTDDL